MSSLYSTVFNRPVRIQLYDFAIRSNSNASVISLSKSHLCRLLVQKFAGFSLNFVSNKVKSLNFYFD